MESNNFGTEEIVPRCNTGRNLDIKVTTVIVKDLGSPIIGAARWQTHLSNFEPAGICANGGGGIGNLSPK